jgi:putative phage-type endonuclease
MGSQRYNGLRWCGLGTLSVPLLRFHEDRGSEEKVKDRHLETYIVECVHCQQKFRIPVKVYPIQAMCSKCGSKWIEFPYKIVDIEQRTAEWFVWRNQGLGASDATAIMGENPWKSRERLLKEKIAGSTFPGNSATRRGIALEPEARIQYQKYRGFEVRPACLQSKHFDWLRASVDGLAENGNLVVEIKCGDKVFQYSSSTRKVPEYYYGQLQHILAVTGLQKIDYWCYLPERGKVYLCVKRDIRYIAKLMRTEYEFWQELQRRRV